MRKVGYRAIRLFAWLVFGANAAFAQPTAAASADLDKAFSTIYYTVGGRDYPQSASALVAAIRAPHSNALKLFLAVQHARAAIAAARDSNSADTLAHTLATMRRDCIDSSDRSVQAIERSARCVGAVLALFYFESPVEDKAILAFMSEASAEVRAVVFRFDHGWSSNRSMVDEWVEMVEAQEDEVLNKAQKLMFRARLELGFVDDAVFGLYD